jgi:hypothetical protein
MNYKKRWPIIAIFFVAKKLEKLPVAGFPSSLVFRRKSGSMNRISKIVSKIKKIRLIKCIKVETIAKIIYKIIINKKQ